MKAGFYRLESVDTEGLIPLPAHRGTGKFSHFPGWRTGNAVDQGC